MSDKAMALPSRFLFGNVALFTSELFERMHLFCKQRFLRPTIPLLFWLEIVLGA